MTLVTEVQGWRLRCGVGKRPQPPVCGLFFLPSLTVQAARATLVLTFPSLPAPSYPSSTQQRLYQYYYYLNQLNLFGAADVRDQAERLARQLLSEVGQEL